MKPTKCFAKMRQEIKVKTAVTLLSAHARTSKANILHLDQKAASVRLANGFMVSFCSFFGKIFRGG